MSFPREYNVAKKRIKKDIKSSNKISNKKISGVGELTGLTSTGYMVRAHVAHGALSSSCIFIYQSKMKSKLTT